MWHTSGSGCCRTHKFQDGIVFHREETFVTCLARQPRHRFDRKLLNVYTYLYSMPPYRRPHSNFTKLFSIRQHLWSTTRQLLVIPCHRLRFYGRRAFCVAGPSVWNSLLDSLQNPVIGRNSFRQSLKTFLFAMYWSIQHIRGLTTMHYINQLFTYLLGKLQWFGYHMLK